MPSLDPVKAALKALKQQADGLIHGRRAAKLIIVHPSETKDKAVQRVCGDAGLPDVRLNGRPVPHLFIVGVSPKGRDEADDVLGTIQD